MWGHLNITQRAFPWIQKQNQGNVSGSTRASCMWESEKKCFVFTESAFMLLKNRRWRSDARDDSTIRKSSVVYKKPQKSWWSLTCYFWVTGLSQKVMVAFACITRQWFRSGLGIFSFLASLSRDWNKGLERLRKYFRCWFTLYIILVHVLFDCVSVLLVVDKMHSHVYSFSSSTILSSVMYFLFCLFIWFFKDGHV